MNIKDLLDKILKIKEEIPELKFLGEEPLHTKATDVSLSEGIKIAAELAQTLLKYRKITGLGRGIAAPQIGFSKNVFVTYIDDKFEVYINPVIIKKSEETNFYRELCMSSSILWSDIERPCDITITWTDENGETQTKEYTSFMARLIQHEYDHLQGCVCLDKSIPGTISFVDSNPAKEEIRNKPFGVD